MLEFLLLNDSYFQRLSGAQKITFLYIDLKCGHEKVENVLVLGSFATLNFLVIGTASCLLDRDFLPLLWNGVANFRKINLTFLFN